jgi:hypothetical protein
MKTKNEKDEQLTPEQRRLVEFVAKRRRRASAIDKAVSSLVNDPDVEDHDDDREARLLFLADAILDAIEDDDAESFAAIVSHLAAERAPMSDEEEAAAIQRILDAHDAYKAVH